MEGGGGGGGEGGGAERNPDIKQMKVRGTIGSVYGLHSVQRF